VEQREFWSTVAARYDRVVDLQIGPRTRAMVRERVSREGPLGKAVEFGCGTGFFTETLAGKADSLIATDLSPGMLELARARVKAPHVTFRAEDCQATTFPPDAFDTAFVGLVLHFTEPTRTLGEMRRILKPGGTLITVNLDPRALGGFDAIRSVIRVVYRGLTGYRMKPPKGFGRNVLTERELRDLLEQSRLKVASSETLKDPSRSSSIPLEYVKAAKA
jgi:ubiquinone/menaquinone biosynthesis C-methylase UbiE